MRKAIYISLFVFTLASCSGNYEHPMELELQRVDNALEHMSEYVALKESRISVIEESLDSPDITLHQKYGIYGRLYEEYAPGSLTPFSKTKQFYLLIDFLLKVFFLSNLIRIFVALYGTIAL